MNHQQQCGEDIRPGEEASVENRSDAPVSVTIATTGDTRVTLELASGQAMQVAAGDVAARVLLRSGNPEDLLVVKPGPAS